MGNPVMHWQIISKNPDKQSDFYAKLFDWDVQTNNALGYRMIDTGSDRGINGGIWPAPPGANGFVQLLIEVDDVKRHVEQAVWAGTRSLCRRRNCRTATRWRSCWIQRVCRSVCAKPIVDKFSMVKPRLNWR